MTGLSAVAIPIHAGRSWVSSRRLTAAWSVKSVVDNFTVHLLAVESGAANAVTRFGRPLGEGGRRSSI